MSSDKNGVSQIQVNLLPTPAATEPASPPAGDRVLFTPPIDIYESPEGLVLIADLPGVSVKTLELQVQNNKLTLLGRVKNPVPADVRLVHKEYEKGIFCGRSSSVKMSTMSGSRRDSTTVCSKLSCRARRKRLPGELK